MDEKDKTVSLTEEGVSKCEDYFDVENFSDPGNMELNHNIMQALKANFIMKKDVGLTVMGLAELVGHAGIKKNPLGSRGLARINVGHDTDIALIFYGNTF